MEAVVLQVLVHEYPVIPLDAATDELYEVGMSDLGNHAKLGQELLDPLLGFSRESLDCNCSPISQNTLQRTHAD